MNSGGARAPAHLRIVGVFALVWSSFGALDYAMTSIRDPGYIARHSAETIQLLDTLPSWLLIAWPLGILTGLCGSILLLLRSRLAVAAFSLSLATLVAGTAYLVVGDLPAMRQTGVETSVALSVRGTVFGLFVYALLMRRKGVLR